MVETVESGVENVTAQIRTAIRHTAVYGVGSMLAKAIGFLMLPFYTHYLSPVDYGILELLDLSMSLFGMFLNLGITAALLKCYAVADSTREKREVVSTACLFVVSTGIITFLVLAAWVEPLSAALLG